MNVYLSGTISADPKTHRWRREAARLLASHMCISPMRGKDPAKISASGLESDVPVSLFVRRDLADIRGCDVLLLYFPRDICPNGRQSIGTWAELGVAIERRMPIVVVSDDPSVTQHPFLKIYAAAIVGTLKEAVKVIDWLDV